MSARGLIMEPGMSSAGEGKLCSFAKAAPRNCLLLNAN